MGSSLRLKKAEKQSTYYRMPLKYTRDKKTFHMWVINDELIEAPSQTDDDELRKIAEKFPNCY